MKNLRNLFILLLVLGMGGAAIFKVSNKLDLEMVQEVPGVADFKPSWVGQYLSGYHASQRKDYELASSFFARSLSNKGSSDALESQTMTLLLVAGKYSEAFEIAKVISKDSENGLARLALIVQQIGRDNYEAADKLANSVVADPKNNTIVNRITHAWIKYGMKKPEEAKAMFETLQSEKVLETLINYNYAMFSELSGDRAKAEELYNEMIKTKKLPIGMASSAYYFFEGNKEKQQLILDNFENEAQIKQHRKITSIKEAVAESLMGVGGIIMSEYGPDQSAALFRLSTYLNPELDEAKLLLGSILMNEGDYKSANNILRQIGHDSYLNDYAKLAIARNFEQMDQDVKARQYFEALLDNKLTKLDALVSLGDLARKTEDYEAAVKYYTEAIEFVKETSEAKKRRKLYSKKYWAVFFARGVCYERLKNYDAFEADMAVALKLYPNQPDVLNYLGYTWIDLGKNLKSAKQMVLSAHEQRPDDPHITDSVGWALYKLGEHERAVEFIENAATQMPYDPTVNDHLGDIYWELGRRNEAKFQWKRALDNDPDKKLEAQLRDKLERGLLKVADGK